MSDTLALLRRADAGDAAALNILYGRDRRRLRRLIALRAPRTLLACTDLDDLVQEAYLEAHRQIRSYSYQGTDSFFCWLASVGLNRIRNLARTATAEKRDHRREIRLGTDATTAIGRGSAELASDQPGPRTLAVGADEAGRLEIALDRLPAANREVVILARIEGQPLDLVADHIGRTRNATALFLSRSLRRLKRILDQMEAETGSPAPTATH